MEKTNLKGAGRKTNVAFLVVMILIPVCYSSRANHAPTPPVTQTEQTLRYNFPYTCNGERIVVNRCRKDSDQPGFPPTQPKQDYCVVLYPDRPKQEGFTVQTTELRGDLITKLQACGALNTNRPKTEGNNNVQGGQNAGQGTITKSPGGKFTGQTWEYRVDETPTYTNGSLPDPNKTQQLMNQRASEGWQLIPFVGQRLLYFKRAK